MDFLPPAPPSATGPLLLTGATGFLGMELLVRYLERTDRTIYALVRARDDDEAQARLRAAVARVVDAPGRFDHRLLAVRGDVALPGLGLSRSRRLALAESVTEIVHSAASVSFTLPLEEAREINVEGTRRLLELADLCTAHGHLRRFAYVSTAYVAGDATGTFGEEDHDVGQGFRNTYERTKWEAEGLVRTYAERLPVQIFRPSIVVGEQETGWTAAFNVIYGPLQAFAKGASVPLIPGRRTAPVDVVPVDYVADAIFTLTGRDGGVGDTYSLAAGPQASSVGELVTLSAQAFERSRPLIVPPALYGRTVHPLVLRRSSGARRKWLQQAPVFFPYFALRVHHDTSRAQAALAASALAPGLGPPPLATYFDRLVDFAEAARWGRRTLTRVDAAGAVRRRAALAAPPAPLRGVEALRPG
ncbi:MAG TPA: SDR family oxidoreductase [Conexibacter sp.]|nr:SDR family oxidoreductase [Conexibacter sp.]